MGHFADVVRHLSALKGLPNQFATYSIQIDYRQTLFLGEIAFQLQIQSRAARRINSTDLWEYQQKISNFRYRFSLEFQLIPLQIQISGSKQINSVIISATPVSDYIYHSSSHLIVDGISTCHIGSQICTYLVGQQAPTETR